MIFRGAAPRGQIKGRKLRGDLVLESSELVEIDSLGCQPPLVLILNQSQVVAGLHAQSFECRRRKRDLPLGRDLDAERRGHGREKQAPYRKVKRVRPATQHGYKYQRISNGSRSVPFLPLKNQRPDPVRHSTSTPNPKALYLER